MRNDVKAPSGPQPEVTQIGGGASRARRLRRGLVALPLALALIAPGAAVAAEATTGYGQTTPPPKTETTPPPTTTTTVTTTQTATQEAAPTQTTKTVVPGPTKTVHVTTTVTAHATTLPFTGLDLRWVVLAGVLLVGLGGSIMVSQRGRHARR